MIYFQLQKKCLKILTERRDSKRNKGFSLTELLTTVGIIGTLSVVGVRSFQSQTNKSKSAEAKHSLSFIYTAEENFKSAWGTYHENLLSIGAIPSGTFNYDIGFGKTNSASSSISKTDGQLAAYPIPASLNITACTNFYQICSESANNDCLAKTKTAVGSSYQQYFDTAGSYSLATNCEVPASSSDTWLLKNYVGSGNAAETHSKAGATSFKAFATGKLKNTDVWSINQLRSVEHLLDGTQ